MSFSKTVTGTFGEAREKLVFVLAEIHNDQLKSDTEAAERSTLKRTDEQLVAESEKRTRVSIMVSAAVHAATEITARRNKQIAEDTPFAITIAGHLNDAGDGYVLLNYVADGKLVETVRLEAIYPAAA